MNCKKIEKLIPLYVESDLSESDSETVFLHLKSCSGCTDLVEGFGRSQQLLHALKAPDLDSSFFYQVRAAVHQDYLERESRCRWSFGLTRPLYATLIAIVVTSVGLYIHLRPQTEVAETRFVSKPRVDPKPSSVDMAMEPETLPVEVGDEHSSDRKVVRNVSSAYRETNYSNPTSEAPDLVDQPETVVETPLKTQIPTELANMVRTDIQTGDPKVRIVWFSAEESSSADPQMSEEEF